MSARCLLALWRRARRSGRDLDAVSYLVGTVGGALFLAAMTGVLGPSLDARPSSPAFTASPYSANAASAAHALN
ncbi:hypothetical protein AL520_14380 [Achromobacter xylosoxidans]|nr:hypothetical protein AL520_14380 [Achromobacter xylosoxidans]